MMRDKLVKRLISLPPETDVVVQLGGSDVDFLEIVDVADGVDGPTAALLPHPGDRRDTLMELRQRPLTG